MILNNETYLINGGRNKKQPEIQHNNASVTFISVVIVITHMHFLIPKFNCRKIAGSSECFLLFIRLPETEAVLLNV